MSLFLDGYIHNQEQSLKDFLYYFFLDYNNNYDTLDEEGELQTEAGRTRSLGDITAIVNSYYPNTSRDTVKETLLSFGSKLVGHYCSDIQARVYSHKDFHEYWCQGGEDRLDQYGDKITYKTDE